MQTNRTTQLVATFALRHGGRRAMALTLLAALAGCGDLSGLGGTNQYACKAPEGVKCQSMSGTYYNGPGQPTSAAGAAGAVAPTAGVRMRRRAAAPEPAYEPTALRSPGQVLRLWIKPWKDADNDLEDQSYVYLQVREGQWRLEHVQRRVREAYAPLRPPRVEPAAQAPAAAPEPAVTPAQENTPAPAAGGGVAGAASGLH